MASTLARFQEALAWQQRGDLAQAEAVCEGLLREQPAFADAWHLRGLLAFQNAQFERGIECIQKSLALNQRQPAALRPGGLKCQRPAADRTRDGERCQRPARRDRLVLAIELAPRICAGADGQAKRWWGRGGRAGCSLGKV